MDSNISPIEPPLRNPPAGDISTRHIFLFKDVSGTYTTLYDKLASTAPAEQSPFSPRLHTNHAPSEEDLKGIQSSVEYYDGKARMLDEEIADILSTLSMKIARRDVYLKAREDHRALLTPIRRIPFDVMQEIFHASTCEALVGASPLPTKLTMHPSVVISQVCREWRQISLQSPRLWATITVACPSRRNELDVPMDVWTRRMGSLTQMTKLWTERSKAAPIILRVRAKTLSPAPDDSTTEIMSSSFRELTAAVQQSSMQWKEFYFVVEVSSVTRPLLDIFRLTPVQVGSLANLDVRVAFTSSFLDSPDVTEVFALQRDTSLLSVPSLRRMTLMGAWRNIASPEIMKCLPPLTHLELGVHNPETDLSLGGHKLLRILEGIPTLSELIFCHDTYMSVPITRLPSPVLMPTLTSVTLDWPFIPSGWAPSLKAPSLRNLKIIYHEYATIQGVTSGLVETYRQFGSTLTTTSFSHTSVTPPALSVILENLPNVERLDLTSADTGVIRRVTVPEVGSDRFVLTELTGGQDELIWCPKLQVLRMAVLDVYKSQGVIEEAILAFLKKRLKARGSGERRLREVDMLLLPRAEGSNWDVKRELRDKGFALDGLALNIRYGH